MDFTKNELALRIILIAFSSIFGILSISLFLLGLVYNDLLFWPNYFTGWDVLKLPTLLMILGVISFIMAIAGCFCAKNDNKAIFIIYGALLTVILIIEFAVAVISFTNPDMCKRPNSSQLFNNETFVTTDNDERYH